MKRIKLTRPPNIITISLLGVSLLTILVSGVACQQADSSEATNIAAAQPASNPSSLMLADEALNDGISLSNEDAPDFSGVDVVTGEPISLSQFRGSTVLLNLVNYGCNVRQSELVSEQLLIIKDLVEQGIDFQPLSVFCGCCPEDVLRDFALENNLDWPWMLDTEYSVVDQYVDYLVQYGYPTLILIDQNQTIIDITGFVDEVTLSARLTEISP